MGLNRELDRDLDRGLDRNSGWIRGWIWGWIWGLDRGLDMGLDMELDRGLDGPRRHLEVLRVRGVLVDALEVVVAAHHLERHLRGGALGGIEVPGSERKVASRRPEMRRSPCSPPGNRGRASGTGTCPQRAPWSRPPTCSRPGRPETPRKRSPSCRHPGRSSKSGHGR